MGSERDGVLNSIFDIGHHNASRYKYRVRFGSSRPRVLRRGIIFQISAACVFILNHHHLARSPHFLCLCVVFLNEPWYNLAEKISSVNPAPAPPLPLLPAQLPPRPVAPRPLQLLMPQQLAPRMHLLPLPPPPHPARALACLPRWPPLLVPSL